MGKTTQVKIEFCWSLKLPAILVYKGEEKEIEEKSLYLKGNSIKEVIENMKGTDTKVISSINSIIEC